MGYLKDPTPTKNLDPKPPGQLDSLKPQETMIEGNRFSINVHQNQTSLLCCHRIHLPQLENGVFWLPRPSSQLNTPNGFINRDL